MKDKIFNYKDIEIHNADAIDFFTTLENNKVDLTVTSPPYDDLRDYHNSNFSYEVFKDIAKELKNSLDREKVLLESIMKLDETEIETLHNVVFNKKRKAKPKTREHHCVDMKIGNFVLPIVD